MRCAASYGWLTTVRLLIIGTSNSTARIATAIAVAMNTTTFMTRSSSSITTKITTLNIAT